MLACKVFNKGANLTTFVFLITQGMAAKFAPFLSVEEGMLVSHIPGGKYLTCSPEIPGARFASFAIGVRSFAKSALPCFFFIFL